MKNIPTATAANPRALVINPNAFLVWVGDYVTCHVSGRKVRVAKKDAHGVVWERLEATHPALKRNGGPLEDDHLRYFGCHYVEFEPAFITPERYAALFA